MLRGAPDAIFPLSPPGPLLRARPIQLKVSSRSTPREPARQLLARVTVNPTAFWGCSRAATTAPALAYGDASGTKNKLNAPVCSTAKSRLKYTVSPGATGWPARLTVARAFRPPQRVSSAAGPVGH